MADQRSRGFGTTAARCIAVAHTTMLIPTICAAQQRSTPARPSTKPPETCAARSGHRVARCGCWARETAPTSRRSLSKPEPRAHQNLQNADRLRNRSSPDSPLWPFFIPLPPTRSRSAERVNGPKREQAWPCPLSGACVWQRLTPEHAGERWTAKCRICSSRLDQVSRYRFDPRRYYLFKRPRVMYRAYQGCE